MGNRRYRGVFGALWTGAHLVKLHADGGTAVELAVDATFGDPAGTWGVSEAKPKGFKPHFGLFPTKSFDKLRLVWSL